MDLSKENLCPHYENCGGCNTQHLPYKQQLEEKKAMVLDLFSKNDLPTNNYEGIIPSPSNFNYRNKMEFSFGDLEKDGELQLGMHPRGRRFDVVTVDQCKLVDEDFGLILETILRFARKNEFTKYHIKTRNGFLRNLIIRKGFYTGEILINLVTTSQNNHDFQQLTEQLKNLQLKGRIVGFLQTINDDYSDTINCDKLITHLGRDYYYDKLLDTEFKIKVFSFFQPNTRGAEKIYEVAQKYLGQVANKTVFDLYCGAGTIAQTIAKNANKVIGIEIVEEAVAMARENAKQKQLTNFAYIAGDILNIISEINDQPDVIIIDPPRPGIHPKVLDEIIDFKSPEIIYISCNPKSLVRDLIPLTETGYQIKSFTNIDMFPHTKHLETVVHLVKA